MKIEEFIKLSSCHTSRMECQVLVKKTKQNMKLVKSKYSADGYMLVCTHF